MANVQNLIPFTSDQDREKAKINGKKGGVASQKVQAQKRTFKKAIEWLVNSDIKITKGEMYDKLKEQGIDMSKLDTTQVATLGLWLGAVNGNSTNYKTLMEGNNEIAEEGTSTPKLAIEIIDNSNLEKTLYEANQHNKNDDGQ